MNDKTAWEQYARDAYTALAAVVPHEKLRFLQYVNSGNLEWWTAREKQGAVLLKHAKPKKRKQKVAETAPIIANPPLDNHKTVNP